MELRRVGDALLRLHAFSLALRTPLTLSRCQRGTQIALNSPTRKQAQRYFTSSARSAARSPFITTSASKPAESSDAETSETATGPLNWLSVGMGASRTSPLFSPNTQAEGRAASPYTNLPELLMNKGNSADDLLASFNRAKLNRFSNVVNVDRMTDVAPRFEVGDLMKNINREITAPVPVRTPMRLTPRTGRTVNIGPGIDIGRGLKLLEQSCSRNKVRADFNLQRFHERPGLKRKRLRRQRWRKRFMLGFKAAVARVKQMRNQGW